jgi:hypothetical protein
MIISEAEKNRIRKLHRELFILKEHGIGMTSVGSGFVNPQGGTGRVGKFLTRQVELDECGEERDPMEDNVIQRFPPMEENLAGYYDFGEEEGLPQEVYEELPANSQSTQALKQLAGDDPSQDVPQNQGPSDNMDADDGMAMFE